MLDNEASKDLKHSLLQNNQLYELVPPNMHRRNAAEKAIRTFKNHLLRGLATCDPDFPIHEWDRILPQCEITLNLLRTSCINPKLSAWAAIQGIHDFNKWPMAPPGAKVYIHAKPEKRTSWAYHGQQEFYVGPSKEHYRCLRCYLPKTHTEIISDTVKFLPRFIPIPHASIDDHIRNSLQDLLLLLTNKIKKFPTDLVSPTNQQALITLATIFNNDTTTDHHSSSEGETKSIAVSSPSHHPQQHQYPTPTSTNTFTKPSIMHHINGPFLFMEKIDNLLLLTIHPRHSINMASNTSNGSWDLSYIMDGL